MTKCYTRPLALGRPRVWEFRGNFDGLTLTFET
jgi:hypothetical protein